jgi:molecular chaperone GrpE
MADKHQAQEPVVEENALPKEEPGVGGVPESAERIQQLEEEKKNLLDQLVRRQADFENFRKRVEREQAAFREQAEADLVTSLLPVLDALERAVNAPARAENPSSDEYRKGVELIHKQLLDSLMRAGLKPIEAEGLRFDPFYHHAVERVETTDVPDHQVLAELQRGYIFKRRVVRPSLVRVAVHPGASEDGSAREAVG